MAKALPQDLNAFARTISDVLDKGALRMSAYQRRYCWRPEQGRQLVTDLWNFYETAGEGEFYCVGLLALHHMRDDAAVHVIDGQQRLVTMWILFAVFKEMLLEQDSDAATRDVLRDSFPPKLLRTRERAHGYGSKFFFDADPGMAAAFKAVQAVRV
jgi:uncharacterized protein with ParB-like and HNH nuclease domain